MVTRQLCIVFLACVFLLNDIAAYRYSGDKNCTSNMIASNVGGHLFLEQCSNDIAYLGRFPQYMVRFHFSEFLKSVLESCAFYTCDLLHDNAETQHSEQEDSRT